MVEANDGEQAARGNAKEDASRKSTIRGLGLRELVLCFNVSDFTLLYSQDVKA